MAEHLVSAVDIVFPVIHGRFGEDGGIQVYIFERKFGVLINLFAIGSAYVTEPQVSLINAIQELLESHDIPFVGTGSRECHRAFDKVNNKSLDERGLSDINLHLN